MHLHILGIGGTFMSALAILAKASGYTVTGSDENCYPPISNLLADSGIEWTEGYDDADLALKADCIIIGNAIKRGMPVLEAVLNARKPYISGPQWLSEQILQNRRVIAVSGTHGKTTTTAMLTHIFDAAGLNPGFLIGGVDTTKGTNVAIGSSDWFIIEADEYDSAFFDKRPKFMHYRPEVAILNNLEFDHADIYSDLESIQKQFHYLLRMIPEKGIVLKPKDDEALNEVVAKGIYSRMEEMSLDVETDWHAKVLDDAAQQFEIYYQARLVGTVNWPLIGRFNVENALSAIAASYHAGIEPGTAIKALSEFKPVKRRLECRYNKNDITVYDDFAHHPTAIAGTIAAVKASHRHKRIIVVLEFASFTMKMGHHIQKMATALADADAVYILKPQHFNVDEMTSNWNFTYHVLPDVDKIAQQVCQQALPGDGVVVMSNRGFAGIHQLIASGLDR